jgi:hypothetical protein
MELEDHNCGAFAEAAGGRTAWSHIEKTAQQPHPARPATRASSGTPLVGPARLSAGDGDLLE